MSEQTHARPSTGEPENVFAPDGVTVVASRTEVATGNSGEIDTRGFRSAAFYLEVTAQGGTTPTLDVTVEVKDPTSGAWHAIPGAAFAQVLGALSSQRLVICPDVTPVANLAVDQMLGRTIRFVWTIGGGPGQTYTFSIGADYQR
jgi:hypothetical protein